MIKFVTPLQSDIFSHIVLILERTKKMEHNQVEYRFGSLAILMLCI